MQAGVTVLRDTLGGQDGDTESRPPVIALELPCVLRRSADPLGILLRQRQRMRRKTAGEPDER